MVSSIGRGHRSSACARACRFARGYSRDPSGDLQERTERLGLAELALDEKAFGGQRRQAVVPGGRPNLLVGEASGELGGSDGPEFERRLECRALSSVEFADQPGADDIVVRTELAAPQHVAAGADEELEFFSDGGCQIGDRGVNVSERLQGEVSEANNRLPQKRRGCYFDLCEVEEGGCGSRKGGRSRDQDAQERPARDGAREDGFAAGQID